MQTDQHAIVRLFLDKGTTRKRYHGGETVSRLSYCIEDVLNEDLPDRVVLCMGTNNLTGKKQSEIETAKEISDLVEKCLNSGANDVYVAGLTPRPCFQEKIDIINKILEHTATTNNYEFIDNSNITRKHLRRDELHLNKDGEILLARNILKVLNARSIYDDFFYSERVGKQMCTSQETIITRVNIPYYLSIFFAMCYPYV